MMDEGQLDTFNNRCVSTIHLGPNESPAISAVMFSAGVLGNLIALVLLETHRRGNRGKISLFFILVTGLVITDLLGTCMISPVVLVSYTKRLSLKALNLCNYFAFAMTFFSLATMMVLFAMALERALAIGHPYFYEKFIKKRCGIITFPVIYSFCIVFCLFPVMGFGEFIQYCPGTWCFINMRGQQKDGYISNVYSMLYAALLLILIIAVLSCNLTVIVSLVRMHKRQKSRRVGSLVTNKREQISMSEEIDHLILLSIMTITFIICSVPFTVRAYINRVDSDKGDDKMDLLALRFLSVNSIIDPWIFTILRPSVLRLMRSVLCCRSSINMRSIRNSPSLSTRLSTTNKLDTTYGISQKK
ncbi:prostaglandin E2 receptor EP2 subtype-like [Bufo gargarizans]|uniref:prostaglandin E2 receptor EP2 subtype n=1 Tax=Bufo gargarizans TaxID=30331 RepID=UPI001CF14901|nr:prostaglandin E2 receptor EP2 subtype [Bufo gargarizans]XP_044132433.1 prostaglandin E2 receptor EP2 subtype-like [Bufo gargarizans]